MARIAKSELETSADCLLHLQDVLACLDRILPDSDPELANRIGLAAAHLQLVIDILDSAETPKP
ncbi:hypothetical protein LWE61_01580 [Sphingobium sufflavum]|uniref:hypothetical protein n=1 Tax=Sphingobium sufflavum TaxID=1129547 RepID=UPI001F47D82C|nr:hypothetical protein [Sphingobium sufflavum]MCE7795241.1 hypothetical protein [Sphingobium sufflavum]